MHNEDLEIYRQERLKYHPIWEIILENLDEYINLIYEKPTNS